MMTTWLLACLRLGHCSSQRTTGVHETSAVWLLGVRHTRVLISQQTALLLSLLLAQSRQSGMLLGMSLRVSRLSSVSRLLLRLLLLLLLNGLHLASMHLLLLLRLRCLSRYRQMGLLWWMLWELPRRLLLCRTHLVMTRGDLVAAHVLPVAGLVKLMLVVHVLRRSAGVLLHCRCVRSVTSLTRRSLRLNDGRSRIKGVTRLGVVLRNPLLLLLLWLLRLLLLLSRLLGLSERSVALLGHHATHHRLLCGVLKL